MFKHSHSYSRKAIFILRTLQQIDSDIGVRLKDITEYLRADDRDADEIENTMRDLLIQGFLYKTVDESHVKWISVAVETRDTARILNTSCKNH